MKRLLLPLLCAGFLASTAELAGVHAVYVLPMSHGLDQYLANRLSTQHLFRVVTDPKLADAVLSDQVGEGLEAELDKMTLNPEPVKRVEPEKPKDPNAPPPSLVAMMSDPEATKGLAVQHGSFGRARGTVFLVDLKSRQVVWSIFDPAKGMDSKEMDRTASDIVSRLSKDLNPTKK